MPKSNSEKRVCLGAFAGAHGVKGHAVIKTFTQAPEDIASYGAVETESGDRRFTLNFLRVSKPGFAIVAAPELVSREDAESLKGVRLYVTRTALPEPDTEEYYLDDLIGLNAVDETGAPAGRVIAVHNFGAGDILELADIPGVNGSAMAPFTKATTPTIDLREGRIVINRAALDESETPEGRVNSREIISDDRGDPAPGGGEDS